MGRGADNGSISHFNTTQPISNVLLFLMRSVVYFAHQFPFELKISLLKSQASGVDGEKGLKNGHSTYVIVTNPDFDAKSTVIHNGKVHLDKPLTLENQL